MAVQAQLYSDNIGFPLCGSLDWIDNGCGGAGAGFNQYCCSSLQQISQLQQLQHFQPQQQQRNQSLCFDNSVVSSSLRNINTTTGNNNNNSNNLESMIYCQNMVSSPVGNQKHEIDQFIRSQNERLKLLLQEQRKQQVAVLVKKIESKAYVLLRQKDEEIAKAANRTMELQNLLKKLEMENQAWQRVAHENEAVVVSLNNTLEQLREQASCCFNNGVDDAESCCEENREGMETGEENRGFGGLAIVADQAKEQDEERSKTTTMVCKCCYSRSSCVLFLPCRHLCSCKDCAALLDSCPVCRAAKKASIEALIS